jgi:RimJ/RimL family protein N-acetyltransferase
MRPTDLDFMSEMLGDPRSMSYYPRPYRRDEAEAWIAWNRRLYRERGFGLWLVSLSESGEPVGDCGITPQMVDDVEELEVGYHTHPAYQRRGYATEAVAAVRDFAQSMLGLRRLVAIIHPENVASRRVAESIGLMPERDVDHSGLRRQLFAGDLSPRHGAFPPGMRYPTSR